MQKSGMSDMLIEFNGYKPKIAKGAWIASGAKVIGEVEIGEDSSIWFNCVLRGDINSIRIGKRTNIQDLSTLHVWPRGVLDKKDIGSNTLDLGYPVDIGDDVTIGHNCVIHACKIHSRCLIGMQACIMDGAEISQDSIIGAGSVITKGKKFPPCSLILGNPAKFIRELRNDEILFIRESAQNYVRYKNSFMQPN